MVAERLLADDNELQALQQLSRALELASDPRQALREARQWFSQYAPVDGLSVALMALREPAAYMVTCGPLDGDVEGALWQSLAAAAEHAQPGGGIAPRRSSDRTAWRDGDDYILPGTEPQILGEWTVRLGTPAAVVQLLRLISPRSGALPALFADAAQLVALHAIGREAAGAEVLPDPSEACTFEELLEHEVTHAHRGRTPVSLVLVEFHANGRAAAADLAAGMAEKAVQVVRNTARRRDKVIVLCENCLAVIMPKTDARGALVAADRLQRALYDHLAQEINQVSIRLGVGGRDPRETEASELFSRASQALAQARRANSEAAFLYV